MPTLSCFLAQAAPLTLQGLQDLGPCLFQALRPLWSWHKAASQLLCLWPVSNQLRQVPSTEAAPHCRMPSALQGHASADH